MSRQSRPSRPLDRSRSDVSVSSRRSVRLEHITPEKATHDAHVAATQAFIKARERAATETQQMWPPESPVGVPHYHITPNGKSDGSPILRRQSVRFVRPQPNTGGISSNAPEAQGKFAKDLGTQAACDPGRASFTGPLNHKEMAEDYLGGFTAQDDRHTPQDGIASLPSSYRRLRKSRSMFTESETSGASSMRNLTQMPAQMQKLPVGPLTYRTSGSDENRPPNVLKSPKSMSFLTSRGDRPNGGTLKPPTVHDYLVNPESYSGPDEVVDTLSLNIAAPRKEFRKTLRESINGEAIDSPKPSKQAGLSRTARKISMSFKHRLKTFFNIVKGQEEDVAFPPQQIEARKTHVTNLEGFLELSNGQFTAEITADDPALSRVASGVPSFHAVPSNQQLKSRQGSLESVNSDRKTSGERSCVTSWDNSDTTSFPSVSSQRGDWERQRLSVIKEVGTHVSSSSAKHSMTSDQLGHFGSGAAADCQGIYSALVKKLQELDQLKRNFDGQISQVANDFEDAHATSINGRLGQAEKESMTPSTIRHVISDDPTPKQLKTPPAVGHPSKSINPYKASRTNLNPLWRFPPTSESSCSDEDQYMALAETPAQQEERSGTSRTLSSRSSAFFGSPTCHLFRTKSPYRRAIQSSMRAAAQNSSPSLSESNPWARSFSSLPIRCPSSCETEVDKKMNYAESIYSPEKFDQQNASQLDLSSVDDFPKPPSSHGDATIFIETTTARGRQPSQLYHRASSSASSLEWKKWLSAKVSKLGESPGSPELLAETVLRDKYASSLPLSNHVRETAQISDDQEQSQFQSVALENIMSPGENTNRHVSRDIRGTGTLCLPNTKQATFPASGDKENIAPKAPPIPIKSMLRSSPSLSILGHRRESSSGHSGSSYPASLNSIRPRSLVNLRSLHTLVNQPQTPLYSAKPAKRQYRLRSDAEARSSPKTELVADTTFNTLAGSEISVEKRTEYKKYPENLSPYLETKNDSYNIYETFVAAPFNTPQSMGSKHMVDSFLSARRRRIVGSEAEAGAFL